MTRSNSHYDHAPITEAVIDIRLARTPTVSVETLQNLSVGKNYASAEALHVSVGQFQFGPNPCATTSTQHTGYVYKSVDGKYILQAQADNFTLSRLAPYESWSLFSEEAKRLWAVYKESTNPENAVRLATRYINRIDLPVPLADFKDYLRTVPEVSPDLPQKLSGYVMQLGVPLEDIGGVAAITETIVPSPNPEVVSVLLDIDVFVETSLQTDDIWDKLEALRIKKNEVFEACITAKTRSLFT